MEKHNRPARSLKYVVQSDALDRNELIAAAVLGVLLEAATGNARRGCGNVQQRPAGDRQVFEHLFVDHGAHRRARRLQQWR